ncbi:enoyl-CoA hydratase/isomerase family protein [Streptomyces sp. NPDC020096]
MHVPVETVKTAVSGGTGSLILDRPAALNALDLRMVQRMKAALNMWREDGAVRAVVVRSTSPKAFCSGGDIRAVREAGLRGDQAAVYDYFSAEYGLNAAVAAYPKPYVALIDGYALGGGLGISVHGSVRVVTERAGLAMPETAIGFFPDIGASYFLPRLHGRVGWYLGLTGRRISGAAAVECGLATHYVHSSDLAALERELAATGGEGIAEVLARRAAEPPASELASHREVIDRCFAADSLTELFDRLTAEGGDWAEETLAELRRASPSSLHVTFELLRRGADADASLADCLDLELRTACRMAVTHDFAEGVRAALVDKDRKPSWDLDELDTVRGWFEE